jgi:hypothetical protein
LTNQIAIYSKVNDCFISWRCFIVIYLQIHRHTNKISQFWSICLWFNRKQMLNAISLVIKQRKNEFDRIAKVRFFPDLFLYLARVISLSRHLPGSILSREGDIASNQNLLISFKPIICKLNYSHVIKTVRHALCCTIWKNNTNMNIGNVIVHDTTLEQAQSWKQTQRC